MWSSTLMAQRATWDDYGCVPNDPKADNGPALSRILAEQGRGIDVAPVGKARDYYVATTIVWPKRHGGALLGAGGYASRLTARSIGVTRLVWNGPPKQPMIIYRGSGARISQLVIQGALPPATFKAACGILVEGDNGPPTGQLVTDQVTLANLEVGIRCVDYPKPLWGGHLIHYSMQFHGVRIPYWVENPQSVPHTFFGLIIRNGYEVALRFDRGGPLNVYGCYVGQSSGGTLLYVGRSDSGSGSYEIQGLQVDGNAKRLRLVNHGKYAHRVRISGSYSSAAGPPAEPLVLARDGTSRYADVRIDCTNGVRWPSGIAARRDE
jgi:hypothetical protein